MYGCMATGQSPWARAVTTALLRRHMRQLRRCINEPYLLLSITNAVTLCPASAGRRRCELGRRDKPRKVVVDQTGNALFVGGKAAAKCDRKQRSAEASSEPTAAARVSTCAATARTRTAARAFGRVGRRRRDAKYCRLGVWAGFTECSFGFGWRHRWKWRSVLELQGAGGPTHFVLIRIWEKWDWKGHDLT